jgi:hypothetical protein
MAFQAIRYQIGAFDASTSLLALDGYPGAP